MIISNSDFIDMDTKKILTELKNGLRHASPELKDCCFGSKIYKERNYKDFYLLDDINNFFDNPGQLKLGVGTRAIKSSAAFIYNIFGQDEISIQGIDFSPIEYEKHLTALHNRNPAQLDGYLVSKDKTNIKFYETKLLEWSGTPKNLSLSYLSIDNYPMENDIKQIFVSFFENLVRPDIVIEKGEKKRKHKTRVYDAIQMAIHILAIYNSTYLKKEVDYSGVKKIELVNLVWDYDCPRYRKEEAEALSYVKTMNDTFQPLFKDRGFDFSVMYLPFSKFITSEQVVFINPERRQYLEKRYLIMKEN